MQAAVAVGLGVGDIILGAQQRNIILFHEQIRNAIDIINIIANHAHARHIVQVFTDGRDGHRQAPPAQLFHHAVGGFQPVFHVMDGVVIEFHAEFIVQHFELGAHFFDGRAVLLLQREKTLEFFYNRRIAHRIVFRKVDLHNLFVPGKFGHNGHLLFSQVRAGFCPARQSIAPHLHYTTRAAEMEENGCGEMLKKNQKCYERWALWRGFRKNQSFRAAKASYQ